MIMEKVKEDIDVEFDIGNMSIYTTHNAGFSGDADNFEKEIHELSLQNFRKVFGKLLEVRNTIDDTRDAKKLELQIHDFDKSEYHVVLPNGTTLFPRFMPMPSKKDLTKWEKFAKEKGIGRKKKTNMLFDEVTQTYVPRHGSKSLKNLNEKRDVVRVIKPGQDIMTDTFEEDRLEKKESQQKQKIKEIRNRLRAKGHDTSKVVTAEERFARVKEKKEKLKKIKNRKMEKLSANLRIAQSSTASMGKFDAKVHKDEVKKTIGKKKQKMANIFDPSKEVARNKALIGK